MPRPQPNPCNTPALPQHPHPTHTPTLSQPRPTPTAPPQFQPPNPLPTPHPHPYPAQLNKVNAIVASRVASAFTTYRQYDAPRQALMRAQLQRIAGAEGLSENVYEIVSKSLEP